MKTVDLVVIGSGAAGMAAAIEAKKNGVDDILILEKDERLGGILNQCIHNGFGLTEFKEELTGPEYLQRFVDQVKELQIPYKLNSQVIDLSKDKVVTYSNKEDGLVKLQAKAIVMATGCRERTRGNISIPGSRPAGVFTAGVAQNLVNVRNVMIGKRVVILGSGDIGLIMARRLTYEGANVLAIAEIMPEPTGLARNIEQCVYEFGIPLYVKTTVSKIIGKKKLEAVELSKLDEKGKVIPGTEQRIDCDALVLSVGLIPENEVAQAAGVKLFPNNAVDTDRFLQTSVPGIFSCGNSRHVMDLADYVSEQGEMAGRNAFRYVCGSEMESWDEEKSNCMKKGFPEKGSTTCTVCPNGCQVRWDPETDTYSGNRCRRGMIFAMQECTDPVRTVTSTVRVKDSRALVPVKSEAPVRRADVRRLVSDLKNVTVPADVRPGDVVYGATYGDREVRVIVTG